MKDENHKQYNNAKTSSKNKPSDLLVIEILPVSSGLLCSMVERTNSLFHSSPSSFSFSNHLFWRAQ